MLKSLPENVQSGIFKPIGLSRDFPHEIWGLNDRVNHIAKTASLAVVVIIVVVVVVVVVNPTLIVN